MLSVEDNVKKNCCIQKMAKENKEKKKKTKTMLVGEEKVGNERRISSLLWSVSFCSKHA